jgi:hypothetical protein
MIAPRSRELMDKAMEKPVVVLGSEIVAFPQLDSLQKRRSIPNALSALEKQFAGSDAHHNSDMRMLFSYSMWPARLRCETITRPTRPGKPNWRVRTERIE